ncbi:hypothetical protein DFA_06614 [Cavenderia fasciculata]|uniref:Tetratricopeptide repeat protein 7 N-terminal domain-containing protein n=1 Tax=Cavenderia fasciculata TaxID=261658 RepID=F4PJH8_CACFS|nr:uncharacterized protein DFA_06614 [Cavenderia fasciculata]EGG24464.1 hypothetical protein DFA_06614 [Cavenderia fasciculata]|eukprot:XP_004362315.1 hypothetical protein DFA_06614 [Cavenderia fasciculata]
MSTTSSTSSTPQTSTIRNKKIISIESDIEKARSEKDWNSLLSLLKKYSKITASNNENVLEYLVHAERYIADNNYIDAQLMLNKALMLKPDDQEVVAYIGIVDYQRNDINKAIDHLSKLSNPYAQQNNNEMILNPRKVNLLLHAFNVKGKCQEYQGKGEDAIESYKNVINITFRYFKFTKSIDQQAKPFIIDSYIRIAMIHRYYSKIQESIKDFRNCLSSQVGLNLSNYRLALVSLGHLLLRNTCSQSYQSIYQTTSSADQQSPLHTSSTSSEINKLNQQTPTVSASSTYVPNNQVEEAIMVLLHAEDVQSILLESSLLSNDSTSSTSMLLSPLSIQNSLAAESTAASNGSAATAQTTNGEDDGDDQSSSHSPAPVSINSPSEKDMLIYDDLCMAYCRKEQYYPVVEIYEKSLSSKFGETHRWIQLALSLYSSGKYKRSLFIIEECLATNPKNITLILLASKICINHLNQLSKGIIFAKQAISILDSSTSDNILQSRAYLSIGVAYEKRALECKSYNEKQTNQELALSNLKKAHYYDSSNYLTSYHLALIYADIRETRLGLKYIHESLSINSNEPSSWNLLCLLLSSNKTYELAYRTCKYALVQSPNNIELLLTKAKLELALEDGSQALLTYRGALSQLNNKTLTSTEDWDETESIPRNRYQSGSASIVSFDMRSTGTASHRGGIASSSEFSADGNSNSIQAGGDQEFNSPLANGTLKGQSLSSSSTTAANSDSNLSTTIKRRVQLWLALSEAFSQQSMFDDAASCLVQADQLSPNHAEVYYQQGVLLDLQGISQEAASAYRKALAIDPGHTNSAIRVAVNHYIVDKDLLLSENNLTTVLRSYDPTSHHAWFQLGVVLKAKGEIERASECFKRAIELDKTSPLIPYESISRHL